MILEELIERPFFLPVLEERRLFVPTAIVLSLDVDLFLTVLVAGFVSVDRRPKAMPVPVPILPLPFLVMFSLLELRLRECYAGTCFFSIDYCYYSNFC